MNALEREAIPETAEWYFEHPRLVKYIASTGIKTPKCLNDRLQLAYGYGRKVEARKFLEHLLDKMRRRREDPVGDAITSIRMGWLPSDRAINQLKALTYGEPPRNKQADWQKINIMGDILRGEDDGSD